MAQLPQKLSRKLADREAKNAMRTLQLGSDLVDFSSNDYLGLARNELLFNSVFKILSEKNISQSGATGSRLLTGNSKLYLEVEKVLSDFFEAKAALVFNSGYNANTGFFSSVPQRNDIVLYDEYIHASIRDGIKMGNARSYGFSHNNIDLLNSRVNQLKKTGLAEDTEVYVVTESVFSMDGDSPDLDALIGVCEAQGLKLVVDEAHAIGIFGPSGTGRLVELGSHDKVFARIVTFGKAWGGHGAAVLCDLELKNYLINFARSFIYTTGLPPHCLAQILAAHQFFKTNEAANKQEQLLMNIRSFKEQVQRLELQSYFIDSDSAIQCCVIGENTNVKELSKRLALQGMDVRPILSPTVPQGEERLRFCIHAFNEKIQIIEVLKILKDNIVKATLLT